MPAILRADQCPVPVQPSVFLSLLLGLGRAQAPPVAKAITTANATDWLGEFDANAMQQDIAGRGGGAYAVLDNPVDKIVLSVPGSGLLLNISAGTAIIDGPVQVPVARTLAIPDNHPGPTDRAWIWLTQAGTVLYELSLTPPAGPCCLLGSCTTSGGNITAVDTSGVYYLKSGVLWRETADTGWPGDSPPASLVFEAKTAGGLWRWDGVSYHPNGGPVVDTVPSGGVRSIPSGIQDLVMDSYTNYGTDTVYGKRRLI